MGRGKRKQLELADIQDETDIYDRLVIRQKQKTKRPKPLEDPYVEREQSQLHKRLLRIEGRGEENDDGHPKIEAKNTLKEDLPAVVESKELVEEKLLRSIPDVQTRCKYLLDRYKELELDLLFGDSQTNEAFRLFLQKMATDPWQESGLPNIREALFVKVVKDTIAKIDARKSIRRKFVETYGASDRDCKVLEKESFDSSGIGRKSTKLDLPPILLELFDL